MTRLIYLLTFLICFSFIKNSQAQSYSGGDGTSGTPYQIANKADLIYLSTHSANWNLYFEQTTNISFDGDETLVDWDDDGTADWDTEDQKGYSPIGNSTTKFTGSYDGQNYTISNLFIDRADYLGLFGYIGESSGTNIGNITNLNLVDVDISGSGIFLGGLSGYQDISSLVENVDVSGAINGGATTNNVGGLIGSASGSVTNCSFDGDVTGEFDSGGLIGDSYGSVTTSHSSGNVIADNNYAGGLIGRMTSGTVTESFSTSNLSKIAPNVYVFYVGGFVGGVIDGTVSQCYATGNVLSFRDYVGGFAGENEGEINNCFSRGKVTRNGSTTLERFGGFVGWNERGKIINCYSTGAVEYDSGTNPTDKGFAGYINIGTGYEMTDNFWDTQTSGQTTTSGGATGKTTAEMKDYNTFTDQTTAGLTTAWDFVTNPNNDAANNNYWDDDQEGTVNSGYPILSWQSGADGVLPVTWLEFTAERNDNNNVKLNWSTASEQYSDRFIVQRSLNAKDFDIIGEVTAAGNSNTVLNYKFTDENAMEELTYYRLKQLDYDGKYNYSKTIAVQAVNTSKESELSIYPNPAKDKFSLEIHEQKGSMDIEVYNTSGIKIYESKFTESKTAHINCSEWPKGIYHMHLITDKGVVYREKVVVQ